jgi:hypothetical protein
MGVSIVYLGKNDDDNEMRGMCTAIAAKLRRAGVDVQEANPNTKELPRANTILHSEVWFCGHSRFVEANSGIRKFADRNLGGFPMKNVAEFAKSCVTQGSETIRLICCESAQEQRDQPASAGAPPEGLRAVLGNVYLVKATDSLLDSFASTINARVSHLEGLIRMMAELWSVEKHPNQPLFHICGLWGAGDITDDNVPISSFLQNMGSLEAQSKMNDKNLSAQKRDAHGKTFQDAHCSNKSLPDLFGYSIADSLLVEWARRDFYIVFFNCQHKKPHPQPICVKLPDSPRVLPDTFWRNFSRYAKKPVCPEHGNSNCIDLNKSRVAKANRRDNSNSSVKFNDGSTTYTVPLDFRYDGNGEVHRI